MLAPMSIFDKMVLPVCMAEGAQNSSTLGNCVCSKKLLLLYYSVQKQVRGLCIRDHTQKKKHRNCDLENQRESTILITNLRVPSMLSQNHRNLSIWYGKSKMHCVHVHTSGKTTDVCWRLPAGATLLKMNPFPSSNILITSPQTNKFGFGTHQGPFTI